MGSDIAINAADIALTGDDISGISYLKRLSNAAIGTIIRYRTFDGDKLRGHDPLGAGSSEPRNGRIGA